MPRAWRKLSGRPASRRASHISLVVRPPGEGRETERLAAHSKKEGCPPMSTPADRTAKIDEPEKPAMRLPRPPRSPWLYAGVLLIIVVGGIAFGIAGRSVSENCVSDPNSPALLNVPSCSNLVTTAAVSAFVGGIALALGVLLLRQAKVPPPKRVPLAAGIFVALLVVVAGIPLALTPPLGNIGVPSTLPFPIPAGTTFNATIMQFSAFVQAQIPTDPYAPWAPIYIEGAYRATSTVCLYIARSAGPDLGPGAHGVCGTSVSFAFGVTSSTWVLAFYIPQQSPQTVFSATVVITESVGIVY